MLLCGAARGRLRSFAGPQVRRAIDTYLLSIKAHGTLCWTHGHWGTLVASGNACELTSSMITYDNTAIPHCAGLRPQRSCCRWWWRCRRRASLPSRRWMPLEDSCPVCQHAAQVIGTVHTHASTGHALVLNIHDTGPDSSESWRHDILLCVSTCVACAFSRPVHVGITCCTTCTNVWDLASRVATRCSMDSQATSKGCASDITGGLFSPLDHSSGAFSLLRPLLQGSLPAPPRASVPVPTRHQTAQQQPVSTECPLQHQEQENPDVTQMRRHASGGAAAAAQLGGRLQRLRLPAYIGGKGDVAAAAEVSPVKQRNGSGGTTSGRHPLAARQQPALSCRTSGQ